MNSILLIWRCILYHKNQTKTKRTNLNQCTIFWFDVVFNIWPNTPAELFELFNDDVLPIATESSGVGWVVDDEEGSVLAGDNKPIGPKRRLDNEPPLK